MFAHKERSRGGHHVQAQKGTVDENKTKQKKTYPAFAPRHRGVWHIRTSTFIVSAHFCVFVCLNILPFLASAPPFLQFGQFVPVALDFQADLANFWSVQYRKQVFFFLLMEAAGR